MEHRNIVERQTAWGNLAIKGIAENGLEESLIYLCFQSFSNRLLWRVSENKTLQANVCLEKHLGAGNVSFAILERLRQWNATVKGFGIPQLHVSRDTLWPWPWNDPLRHCWDEISWYRSFAHVQPQTIVLIADSGKFTLDGLFAGSSFDLPERVLPHWICFDLRHSIVCFTVKYIIGQ